MDMIEFLRARLDEDEAWAHYSGDPIGHTLDSRARVLADVAAKRAVIGELIALAQTVNGEYGSGPLYEDEIVGLRHLAAVYSEHPDYRQEWKP